MPPSHMLLTAYFIRLWPTDFHDHGLSQLQSCHTLAGTCSWVVESWTPHWWKTIGHQSRSWNRDVGSGDNGNSETTLCEVRISHNSSDEGHIIIYEWIIYLFANEGHTHIKVYKIDREQNYTEKTTYNWLSKVINKVKSCFKLPKHILVY